MRYVTTKGTTNLDKETLRKRNVERRLLGRNSSIEAARISKHAFSHWGLSIIHTPPSGDDGGVLLSGHFAYCRLIGAFGGLNCDLGFIAEGVFISRIL